MSTVDQSTGFRFRYRPGNLQPTILDLVTADTELNKGDMVNLESGEIDLAATADTNLVGVVLETNASATASTTRFKVISDEDAVYEVYDAVARSVGDTLDIAGATGAQTVAASSNKEFVVVADSTATEPTLVRFNVGKHYLNKAQ